MTRMINREVGKAFMRWAAYTARMRHVVMTLVRIHKFWIYEMSKLLSKYSLVSELLGRTGRCQVLLHFVSFLSQFQLL